MAGGSHPGSLGVDHPALLSQAVFRRALDAIAHPGRIVELPAAPAPASGLAPGSLAMLRSLADSDTPVWLDPGARSEALVDHLQFHCGCPIVDDPAQATFVVATNPSVCPHLSELEAGTPDYPDRSATLILEVGDLVPDRGVSLTGPGIETRSRLSAAALPDDFWSQVAANNALFPLGIDIFLVAGARIAALPRSVTVEG